MYGEVFGDIVNVFDICDDIMAKGKCVSSFSQRSIDPPLKIDIKSKKLKNTLRIVSYLDFQMLSFIFSLCSL